MNRVFASWWESLQLLQPREMKPLLLLTLKSTFRISSLWPIWLAASLYGALLWYVDFRLGLLGDNALTMQLSSIGGKLFEGIFIFFLLGAVRSSVDKKDFWYFLSKFRWSLVFFPLYFLLPYYLIPFLILYMFFYLDSFAGMGDLWHAFYNSFVMLLYNLPLITITGGLGALLVYGVAQMISSIFVQIILFAPLVASFIWVFYTKRLYDEMSLYTIE